MLVLCTGNSARSQMAETILRDVGGDLIVVESAGTVPAADIHPFARAAVRKLLNIDMHGQYPKRLDRFLGERFDYVITVCDHAAETCPVFPGAPERIHWSFEDPAAAGGTEDERRRAFDAVAAGLLERAQAWLPSVRARVEGLRA